MTDSAVLLPGETCWRIDRADRLRLIVDGADYFRAVKRAMLAARQTIMMIGWDFDTRVAFEPEGATMEGPNELGPFMKWMAENREDVDVYMLKWDLGTFQALWRGMVPMALRPIRAADNFHFKFDTEHPAGAAHHSKVIVVDDHVAFCGGIDLTAGRWDNPEHLDDQPHRHMPGDDTPSKPWHDVTTAVSGPLAAALGDLGRQRWFRATGEALDPPGRCDGGAWPDLDPTFRDIPVAIARTYPDHNEHPEVREIEALYLRAIERAERSFYVETQYLASGRIARAIAARLSEPEGPEFVVIMPQTSEGWLRQKAMDGAREKLLRFLWANDPHDRFRAYYPVTTSGAAIYVHAKVLIVDDCLLRVGSSNLNNRSMGFDTECDVAVEAEACPDPKAVSRTLAELRYDLVAEHLGLDRAALEAAWGEAGMIGAIERLRGSGKTLHAFDRGEISEDNSILSENDLADPEAVEDGLLDRFTDGIRDLFREGAR
jgi:phosphatidylserine/phosphatidylglycerophosphate/cardiolipin synthase-like enzyme